MLRSLLGFDWRKSKAHWLLLSKFLRQGAVEDFTRSDSWKAMLGEEPSRAIGRFLKDGLLEEAGLDARLSYKFRVSDLKSMAKERNLPASGSKDALIQRLIEADPKAMGKAVSGLMVFICSSRGRELAEQYLAEEQAERSKVEQQVLDYLRQRRFKEASVAVASYEAQQVFPRGMGIDWKHYNPTRDVAILKAIWGSVPRILGPLSSSQVEALRLGAAMMELWGTNQATEWLPPSLETGLAIDNDTAARMFLFHAIYKVNLAEYRQSEVVMGVEVLATSDSCDACKAIAGKKYTFDAVPELPYEYCTHEMGCRCTIVAVTKSYSEILRG